MKLRSVYRAALSIALCLLAVPAVAGENEFVGAFEEMMPDVSYTADRETTMSMGSMEQEMTSRIVYTPVKEWASTRVQGMSGTEIVTVTDYQTGKLVTSVLGVNTVSEIAPMQSLNGGQEGASIEFVGASSMNGVQVNAYDFNLIQQQGEKTYRSKGRLLLDDEGIPRVVIWTIESDGSDTIRMRQQLSNIQIGPVDESKFAVLETPVGSGGANSMAAVIEAARKAESSDETPSASGAQQYRSIQARLRGWPGGQGRLIDDNGTVVGTVDDSGSLSIAAAEKPAAGVHPIRSGYTCDGATLSDPAAGFAVLETFTVVDALSTPLGVVSAASSPEVLAWWANPAENSAVPGFRIRLVYVDRPVQSSGVCTSGSERQERRLDFQTGWNIEKHTVVEVGDSPFFQTKQPAMTVWETLESVPSGTIWQYEEMTSRHQQARKNAGNLPEPVEENLDTAPDAATGQSSQEAARPEAARQQAGDKIRRGIGRLFGN